MSFEHQLTCPFDDRLWRDTLLLPVYLAAFSAVYLFLVAVVATVRKQTRKESTDVPSKDVDREVPVKSGLARVSVAQVLEGSRVVAAGFFLVLSVLSAIRIKNLGHITELSWIVEVAQVVFFVRFAQGHSYRRVADLNLLGLHTWPFGRSTLLQRVDWQGTRDSQECFVTCRPRCVHLPRRVAIGNIHFETSGRAARVDHMDSRRHPRIRRRCRTPRFPRSLRSNRPRSTCTSFRSQ